MWIGIGNTLFRTGGGVPVVPPDPYGPELITNGDFSTGLSWTLGASWTIGSGVATYDDIASSAISQINANMESPIKPSTNYILTFDLAISSGHADFGIFNYALDQTYVSPAEYTAGSKTILFTTPIDVSGAGFQIYAYNSSSNPFTIDNISLKEVL